MTILTCRFCGKIQYRPEAVSGGGFRCTSCYNLLSMDGVPLNPGDEQAPGEPAEEEATPFGKYALHSEIGRGSMGIVYDAKETTLNRRVAVKIMFARKSVDPKEAMNAWQRFIQEARLSANVSRHPNLVTVYEAGVHEGQRYIAMEHIQGRPMPAWREESKPGRRDQVRLLRDVALAVHHAHENGIIHRDLKPGNVLVDDRNTPYVTDFGVAKSLTTEKRKDDTPSGLIVGSPAYMSPEQATGRSEVDRRTDVYSLGVMLYEIIAGRVPFGGRSPVEILSQVVDGPVPTPTDARGNGGTEPADAALDAVCLKAMARKPGDRYANALDLAAALSDWLGDTLPIPALARPSFRSPLVWIGGALAVLVGVGLFAAWTARLTRQEADAHAGLGHSLLKNEKHQEALLAFERALALAPDHAGALEGKAEVTKNVERFLDEARRKSEEDLRRLQEVEAELERLRRAPLEVALTEFKPRDVDVYQVTDRITMYSGGTTIAPVPVSESGTYEIQVVASCREAGGEFAKFRILVDERPVSEIALESEEPRLYKLLCPLEAGTRKLGIEYTNDLFRPEQNLDRNLYLHSVVLRWTR